MVGEQEDGNKDGGYGYFISLFRGEEKGREEKKLKVFPCHSPISYSI